MTSVPTLASEKFEDNGFVYSGYKDSPARCEIGSKPKPINWYAGKQYDDCFGAATVFAGARFAVPGFCIQSGFLGTGWLDGFLCAIENDTVARSVVAII